MKRWAKGTARQRILRKTNVKFQVIRLLFFSQTHQDC